LQKAEMKVKTSLLFNTLAILGYSLWENLR
jgi:hypothetical protein